MVIDYGTPEGKMRMRLGDTRDLPFLPSAVYEAVYTESNSNLNNAVITCGKMILAQLSYKTQRKLGLSLQVWGKEAFDSYKEFLILTVSNPAFMDISPIAQLTSAEFDPIVDFQANWNANYTNGTESQQLARNADTSPNDNSRTGWNFVS